MPNPKIDPHIPQWFVMRDLKRHNAKCPAYQSLAEQGFEVFTPMKWVLTTVRGKRIRSQVPFLTDLLFVHSSRDLLDPVVALCPTLQYRFVRGSDSGNPMTVRDVEMDRFVQAVRANESPQYYSPGEITPQMLGRRIRVVGGPFDGFEGHLLAQRGARKKKLLVELPQVLVTSLVLEDEFIEFLDGDSSQK